MNEKALAPELTNYRDPSGGYLPVSIEGLTSGTTTELELFTRINNSFFVVKPRDLAVTNELIARFRKTQTPYLYIRTKDREHYQQKLEKNLTTIIASPSLSVREKAGILTDHAVDIVDQLFSDPGNPNTLKSAQKLTGECVRFISSGHHAFLHLVELSGHDQYTYAHSVGVAAYTIALAPHVMNVEPQTLADMGLAALLHDIGKSMVDPAIINKKGPLNEDEWAVMKKHPAYGAEIIRRHKSLNPIVLLAAEGHHENLIGSGYPRGMVASKIDPLVRIVSLTDAFSAMTTKRTYSQARDNLTALKLIKENLNTKFDAKLFQPFVKLFLEPTNQIV